MKPFTNQQRLILLREGFHHQHDCLYYKIINRKLLYINSSFSKILPNHVSHYIMKSEWIPEAQEMVSEMSDFNSFETEDFEGNLLKLVETYKNQDVC